MFGRWAQAGGWLCRGLPSRLNKTLPAAATACFFSGSFTHAHTRVAAGATFRRPVHRTAVATTTQRHMHSLTTQSALAVSLTPFFPHRRFSNRLRGFGPLIQSSSLSEACVQRTFPPIIRANPVAAVSPLPTRQLQPTRSVATHPQSTDKKSRFRGVCWHKRDSKWMSAVTYINLHVGNFDCEVSAARHYDTAIGYLVHCKVLDEKYLARTNVSLGLLEQFVPTAEETERVARRWKEWVGRDYSSVFRGVYRDKGGTRSGRFWRAHFRDECGKLRYIGCFSTEVEAACAVDEAVRASKLPKLEKIKRINFYRERDYLTEGQARKGGCIGVYRDWGKVLKPWFVRASISTVAEKSILSTPIRSFLRRPYLGYCASKLEAIEVHGRFVLDQWAQQDEPRGPLPPTTLSPTRYGYKLIIPHTETPVKKTVAENAPERKKPITQEHSPTCNTE